MHDLLRQLAGHLSGEECFCGDILSFSAKPLSKLRRVSIASDKNSLIFPNVGRDHIFFSRKRRRAAPQYIKKKKGGKKSLQYTKLQIGGSVATLNKAS